MDAAEASLYVDQVLTGDTGQKYCVDSKFGDGGFAGVFQATQQGSGRIVAIKILGLAAHANAAAAREFQDEIAMLRTLNACSNIVELLDSGHHVLNLRAQATGPSVQVPALFMVLELAVGSLEDLLASRHQVDWLDRLMLFREMVKGVHQMHLRRMVHRDVKSENGLVFESAPKARVCDLGRSKDTRRQPRVPPVAYEIGRGDIRFASPELLWGLGDNSELGHLRTDLYLLGSLLYEIATATGVTSAALTDPWGVLQQAAALDSVNAREQDYRRSIPNLRKQYELVYETFAQELPRAIAQEGTVLLRQLTDPDPEQREPIRPFRGLPMRWDLQWILIRIDIMTKRLATDGRKASAAAHRWGRRKVGVRK